MFDFKIEKPIILALLMCLYTLIDAICLLNMSLATYCVIKFCLLGTWKVSMEPTSGEWN